MSKQKKIENSYKKMYQAIIDKDRNTLLEILDDSFVLVHMTGMRQAKTVFIRVVGDGTLNYYSADHQRIYVKLQENEAELVELRKYLDQYGIRLEAWDPLGHADRLSELKVHD